MDDDRLKSFLGRLGDASTFEARRAVVEEAAAELDSTAADSFEVAATRFAEVCTDTVAFAREAMDVPEMDRKTRFLIFTMGAIACRRKTDRMNARKLFGGAGNQFDDIPLFKHLEALSYEGGSLRDLQRGLELEREAYETIRPQAGSAHAIATFVVQIAEQGEDAPLEEALDYVDEAIDQRGDYAKFHFTKGRVLRQLERWKDARASLLKAIELENRATVDAPDRLRDYRLELTLVGLDRDMSRMAGSASEAARGVDQLKAEVKETTDRLQGAQVQVIAAIGFVASAIGLVQVTVEGFGDRPFIEVLALVATFAVVLFGATFFGVSTLRRR